MKFDVNGANATGYLLLADLFKRRICSFVFKCASWSQNEFCGVELTRLDSKLPGRSSAASSLQTNHLCNCLALASASASPSPSTSASASLGQKERRSASDRWPSLQIDILLPFTFCPVRCCGCCDCRTAIYKSILDLCWPKESAG